MHKDNIALRIGIVTLFFVIIFIIGLVINTNNRTEETKEIIKECYKLDLDVCVDCCYNNRTTSYMITEDQCNINCYINNQINKAKEVK